jgi:hypothetical protein
MIKGILDIWDLNRVLPGEKEHEDDETEEKLV